MTEDIVVVRGVHPNEVSAFYIAKKVSETLKKKGFGVSLETVPYRYTYNYLADHKPKAFLKHYEFLECLEEAEELKLKKFKDELRKSNPSVEELEIMESVICDTVQYPLFKKIKRTNETGLIFDFHNSPVTTVFDFPYPHSKFFNLCNGYKGYVGLIDGNEYEVEIPAFYKDLPREILKRRSKVIRVIKRFEQKPEKFVGYLSKTVDFKRTHRAGLTDDRSVGTISDVIEEVLKENTQSKIV